MQSGWLALAGGGTPKPAERKGGTLSAQIFISFFSYPGVGVEALGDRV